VANFDKIVVIDFETTGLGPWARPVEVAWIQVDRNLNEISRSSSFVNPGIPIESQASAVNGITDETVSDSPTLDEFMRSIQGDPFAEGRTLAIAHNASFDYAFFTPFCGTSESLCTMRLARFMFTGLRNYKLETLCNQLHLGKAPAHRAMPDAEVCLALATYMANQRADGLDGLLALSATALSAMTMPFGKHKNTPIADLPSSYVRWMRAEMSDLDGDLRACLDLHHP